MLTNNTFLDIETVGLKTNSQITQIGVVECDENFKIIGKFNSYISPYGELENYHKMWDKRLTIEDLDAKGIRAEEAAKGISRILARAFKLYIYNAYFDSSRISLLLNKFNMVMPPMEIVDVMKIARPKLTMHEDQKRYSLEHLCMALNVKIPDHTALNDALATRECYLKIISNDTVFDHYRK